MFDTTTYKELLSKEGFINKGNQMEPVKNAAEIDSKSARVIAWLSDVGDTGLEQSVLTRRLNSSAKCKSTERENLMADLLSKNLITSRKKFVPGKRTPVVWFLTEDGKSLAEQIEQFGIAESANNIH